jgi:Na+/melibiose symporter-like transporter
MSIKIATGVSLLLVGPVLSWVGYKPGATGITPQAAENLRMLFAIGPASIYFISALVFSRYPITRATHRAMRDRLAARTTTDEEKSRSTA